MAFEDFINGTHWALCHQIVWYQICTPPLCHSSSNAYSSVVVEALLLWFVGIAGLMYAEVFGQCVSFQLPVRTSRGPEFTVQKNVFVDPRVIIVLYVCY